MPLFAALAQPGTSSSDEVVEDFNAGHIAIQGRMVSVDGFKAGDRGWYLDSGASGSLVYRVPGRPGSTIGLNFWVYASPGVTNSIIVSATGVPATTLATNANLAGTRLQMPSAYASASSVDVEIQARNSSSVQVLVIDQLVTYISSGTDPRAPPLFTYLAFGGLVALLTLAWLRSRRQAVVVAAAMGVVVATATAARVTALFLTNRSLDPDAVGYRLYADRFQWWPFSNTGLFSGNFGEREPLFPAVVHAYFQVLGSSDFHLRVVSVTLSITVVILSVVAARRRLLLWPAAIGVGFLLAVSGPLIQESVRGLRLEFEIIVVLLLYLALDRNPSKRPLLDAVVVGVIGAAMVLTRTYYLPLFGAAVLVSFLVRYRPSPRTIGLVSVAVVIVLGAAVAHRAGLYEHHGDPFYDTAGYDRWDANVEVFALHRPLPHAELFPTPEQYQKFGPYFGPPLSTFQYFIVIHSPQEVARDSLAGAAEIFDTLDGTSSFVSGAAQFQALPRPLRSAAHLIAVRIDLVTRWLVLLGLMALLARAWRHPHIALIPVIVISWLGLTSFLFDHGLLECYRHTWQTMPLALIAGAWLLQSAVLVLKRGFSVRLRARDLYDRLITNVDVLLLPVCVLLALAQAALPARWLTADDLLLAISIGILVYRRPAAGVGATLLAVSVAGNLGGASAGAAALAGILGRTRPPLAKMVPLAALVPFGLAVILAGGKPTSAPLYFVAVMLFVVAAVTLAAGLPEVRQRLLWLVAAIGPIAGLAYTLEPAAAPAVELVPVGLVVAAWLYLQGHRLALPLGLTDLAIVVLVHPFFAWLGAAVALAWLAWDLRHRWPARQRIAVCAAVVIGLIVLAAGEALAATTPPTNAAWSARLADTTSSMRQRITVDRSGDSSIWFYGRRASAFADYSVVVDVNGVQVTSDLNAYLPTDQPSWTRVPLASEPPQGETLDVQLMATGTPNPTDRFVEIGGVYATAADLTSSFFDGSGLVAANGTYLIVLGDSSQPQAPDGLPEPMVHGRWQPPMGWQMPGEQHSPIAAREQANVLQIWGDSFRSAAHHPLGLGTDGLAPALNSTGAGFGPGLSARNEFLQAAAEWGAPGLAGLLILLGAALWSARRSSERLPAALLALTVVSMAGESLLADSAGAVATWLVLGLCLGVNASRAASRSISRA